MTTELSLNSLLAVPLAPLAGSIAAGLFGKAIGRKGAHVLTILGVLVSLSSIGAGALGATMILLLYPRLDMKRLVGSDIAHAVPLTIVAGIGHASLGNVDWEILVELLIGSIPAIWLSAKLTKHLPETITRFALCACLVLAAKKVLLTA